MTLDNESPTRSFARRLRRAQTAAEVTLWRELRDRRLDGWKFRRQDPIEGYIADFLCFEARLIVEVDGPLHEEIERKLKDRKRDTILLAHGFRTLRFAADAAPGRMIEAIRQALAQSSPHPAFGSRRRPPSPARGEGAR
jgi:very-short-patch-repair endonuclease